MPAQIEAQRAKIDCSRKQVTNDGPNWKQFVGPDEGVAYSSVYYLNMPIKHLLLATIKYFCWIRADPLLIFWEKEQGQCELKSCLRHFTEIEEVRSSSQMRVQICGVWPRAVMRETAEMAGPAAEKKIGRWQCKHRDPHDKLLMCWFDHAYSHNNPCEVLFLILVQLILVGITTTLATSLMVKSIVSSLSCKQYFRISQATSFDKRLCCISDAAIACKCSEILGHKCIATVKICSTANRRQEFVKPAMILCKSRLYEYRKRPPV